jgi:flagellar assembly protein FliH
MAQMSDAPRKFTFDTVFDQAGDIAFAPTPIKRSYSPDEVEQIRKDVYAEGQRSATVKAEEAAAAALADIGATAKAAMTALAEVAHANRAACAELALAVGRAIADAALEAFPEAPAQAALAALSREVESAPKLTVRAPEALVERLQAALNQTAQALSLPGEIVVKGEAAMPPAAFSLDWSDGRATFDPVQAGERVAEALRTALAAEGLHAEPLIPSNEAPNG